MITACLSFVTYHMWPKQIIQSNVIDPKISQRGWVAPFSYLPSFPSSAMSPVTLLPSRTTFSASLKSPPETEVEVWAGDKRLGQFGFHPIYLKGQKSVGKSLPSRPDTLVVAP